MAFFLLEIGTEELPADFARLALPQLEDQVRRDLLRSSLSVDRLEVTSTPRRLAVLVDGLPARQVDLEEEHKGPPAQQAFRDGVPTAAAEGFAKRCGLPVEQLEVRETPKGPFVFGRTRQSGRATAEVLAELIPGWIWGLQGRRFMRWGQGESRFSRPVRWLVALLDEDIIPVDLPGCDPPIQSGRHSRGHRLNPQPVDIPSAAAYISRLAAEDVQVDRLKRAQHIQSQLEEAAARSGARLDLPEDLFEELVDLVEDPRVIEGAIEPSFLSLPPEVLSTVMRAHQRYVPLLAPEALRDPLALSAERALMPLFLCVSNGQSDSEAMVRRGNERVLRARLADAAFFLKADHAVPSIDRREALNRVTFADGLGSLRDRTERLEWCTDVLLAALPLQPAEAAQAARRAAHLSKHDLVSQMVGEFPELQGIMGAKYLLAEGEGRDVALAVLEHYLPRGAGDALPESIAGAVLSLAERLELLFSIFARGDRPTGSSDPYGLRRAANGVLQVIWHQEWSINLYTLLGRISKEWQRMFPELKIDSDGLSDVLVEYFQQRWIALIEEEGFNPDIAHAIAGSVTYGSSVLCNPFEARQRAGFLQTLRDEGRLLAIQSVVQRASRLAEKGQLGRDVLRPSQAVDPGLFESQSEEVMFAVLEALAPIAEAKGKHHELASYLYDSSNVLDAFFDGADSVLVMCDDPSVRRNRLNLLSVLRNQANTLADFSKLENRIDQ